MNSVQQALQQSLLSSHNPADCSAFQAQLPLFISDELLGKDVDTLYPDIAQHIDICPSFSAEYQSLSEILSSALYSDNIL